MRIEVGMLFDILDVDSAICSCGGDLEVDEKHYEVFAVCLECEKRYRFAKPRMTMIDEG